MDSPPPQVLTPQQQQQPKGEGFIPFYSEWWGGGACVESSGSGWQWQAAPLLGRPLSLLKVIPTITPCISIGALGLLLASVLPCPPSLRTTTMLHPCHHAARKEMGLTDGRNKKLSANALRTLESVYARTPFPSREVIK